LDGLFGYQEPAAELLRLYKFGGESLLVQTWAKQAAARIVPPGPLVPVPALQKRLWARGWDPVGLFVQHLALEADLPVWKVLRRRASAAQKTLGKAARIGNAQRAYCLPSRLGRRLKGISVVWLVDDVVTTGATVEACSRLLIDAGVHEVRVFCLGLH